MFEVAYHNALKRIVGAPIVTSTHDIAEYCNMYMFKHYIAFLQIRYLKRILKSNNALMRLCCPLLMLGYHALSLSKLVKDRYQIDITENGVDAIGARISWVQRHEVTTGVRYVR